MILYHGTNDDILSIDLQKGLRFKDFGKGFYLTPDKTTAIRMAQKKARLYLDQQYYFGTERALSFLHKTNSAV